MPDLSVLIPARNEEFLARTIESVLSSMRGDTEVIAVLDGYWPDPPIHDHSRVHVIHHTVPVGQRGGTNEAARLARGKYLMKLDAHCSVDEGFDVKLVTPYETGEIGRDVTTIPRMYNLHAFDFCCDACGHRTYQGALPKVCEKCKGTGPFHREMVWKPRLSRRTDFGRFDRNIQFQYWKNFEKRPESKEEFSGVLCSVGACWVVPAKRYWELGGMDEKHGSWGQMGVEVACKAWLSGGRQVVNKRTWFAHMFRTQPGWHWPYHITQREIDQARAYSRDVWENGRWPKARYPLSWLVQRFAPVPEWHPEEVVSAPALEVAHG